MAGVNPPMIPSAKLKDMPTQVNRTEVVKRFVRIKGRRAVMQVMGMMKSTPIIAIQT